MSRAWIILFFWTIASCERPRTNVALPTAEYTHGGGDMITVHAATGFRKPGVHHVPKDTTLREFLAMAEILSNYNWGEEEFMCGCRVLMKDTDNRPVGFQSPGKPSESQLSTPLRDEAVVSLLKWSL